MKTLLISALILAGTSAHALNLSNVMATKVSEQLAL